MTTILCTHFPLFFDPFRSPCRYDVEASETAFCCGGLLRPCTTPGCTECGTHYQPLELAFGGRGGKPWCIPSYARCTESKERTTCEVCRRRIGLEPLPTCQAPTLDESCHMSGVELWLLIKTTPQGPRMGDIHGAYASASISIHDDQHEAHAHQDGTVEVFRARQLIGKGRWGKKGLGRVEGVVSGIEPIPQELLDELDLYIRMEGEGPIENDIHTCERCGGEKVEGHGVHEGGIGAFYRCTNEQCPSSSSPSPYPSSPP